MNLLERIAYKLLNLSAVTSGMETNKWWGKRQRLVDPKSLIERNRSWVYRCAQLNAQAIAAIPLRLYVRGGTNRFPTKALGVRRKQYLQAMTKAPADDVQELLAHPLLDLLDSVNPHETGYGLVETTVLYEELTGNAYWYLIDGQLGIPAQVWPLMSQYVTIVPDEEEFISGYLYGKDSRTRVAFKPEEIIQFKYANPADLHYGMSPLEAALRAADLGMSMQEHQQALYDNNARPDFSINVPAGTPKVERDRLLTEWKQHFQGRKKAGQPVILTGDMTIGTIGFPPTDMLMLESAKYSREEIANMFGIPMSMLEISASRAEAEAHQANYARYTLVPRLRRLEQTMTERLASRYDERLFLAFDNPVPEDVEQRLKVIESHLKSGYSVINEERAIDGQDAVEWGEEPLIPTSLRPMSYVPPAPIAPGQGNGPDDEPPKDGKGHKSFCQCDRCKGVLPPMTPGEKRLAATMDAYFERYRDEALRRIGELRT